jgi:Na+:H+ antiporter, NhaA family
MPLSFMRKFIQLESASGIILCFTGLLGLMVANSPLSHSYYLLLNQSLYAPITFNLIINDCFMAIFFFLVGLEIKREILIGELNSTRKIMLPAIAALAGMIVPAAIYLLCNAHDRYYFRGWAIPTATDIAFALAILNLLGKRIPLSIKVFLTALAIFDDLGAIIIIAIFYTKTLAWSYLIVATIIFILLLLLPRFRIKHFAIYLLLGVMLWYAVLQSGIHPTIAGVLFAFTIPIEKKQIENQLHPWVAYFILPLFAFANTGIPINEFEWQLVISSLPLGILLGLFLGKQLGVFFSVLAAVKCRIAELPTNSNWRMIYGTALLCGIGFTMSLFIGGLAFTNINTLNLVRVGVLMGSLLSGITGYLVLRFVSFK